MLQSIKRYAKYVGCFLLILSSLQALAQDKLSESISRQVLQQQAEQEVSPILSYRLELAQLSRPDSTRLMPILRKLIPYNQVFAQEKMENFLHEFAILLNTPVKVTWKTIYSSPSLNSIGLS